MSVSRRLAMLVTLAGAVLVGASLAPAPALAAGAPSHCVVQLDPVLPGQTASVQRQVGCYASVADSLRAATGVRAGATTAATNVNVISILYVDDNYGGSSLTITDGGSGPCTSSRTYGFTSMPGGWNDVVTSIRGGFDGCTWTRIWENSNYSGANLCFANSNTNVGNAMNDRTSSLYWRVANPC